MCENRVHVTKLSSTQRSVDGKILWLDIVRHDTSNLCFEFTVKNVSVFFMAKEFATSIVVIVYLLTALDIRNPNLFILCLLIFVTGRLIAKLLWSVNSG
jgi:hypothetical protein